MARANVSVRDDQNFRSRCEQEQKAFDDWPNKWEWILDEYKERNEKLNAVKKNAMMRKGNLNMDLRSVLPFPNTTSREIGWLSSKQEFQLEIFGPYITHLPIEIKPNYKNDL
ncbi:uncharacterized protein LOC111028754 [Myzus persicae]|uniref:uncharacterized protein LOC111028754 n=1 Tax=Myzus persicae TaxID=13164 RepID=UPI000B9381E3|nr:uncharacterized protein LOC111028754 [Myzus persicae]